MAYLGPHSTETRDLGSHRVKLVIPSAASLQPSRASLLGSLSAAAETLQVGAAPESLLIVAAPVTVDWGPYGLTQGPDAWVRADQPLADPNSVWLHEYVHLRQTFATTPDARWTTEAMAEYYAALLALEQGHISFQRFAHHLAEGRASRYDDTILAQPGTWTHLGNYVKGALVWGALDLKLRVQTGNRHTASDVLAAMNRHDGPVANADLRRIVTRLGGRDLAGTLDRFATTTAAPGMWSRTQHREAFSRLPARFTVELADQYTLRGPYRNVSVDFLPVLVPGERLEVEATVRNQGQVTGEYSIPLTVNGTVVGFRNGTLAGGSATVLTVAHVFERAGTYRVGVGESTRRVRIVSPSRPQVRSLNPSVTRVPAGGTVSIELLLANPTERPGAGTLSVLVDGEGRQRVAVRLGVGETVTKTVSLTFSEPGEHTVSVGNSTTTIRVISSPTSTSETMPTTAPGTSRTGPTATGVLETTDPTASGLGPIATLVTLLILALFARLRRG
ncbi:MAG: hypothetical protein ABEI31_05835 [Halodesulfurarchaeum sp.]